MSRGRRQPWPRPRSWRGLAVLALGLGVSAQAPAAGASPWTAAARFTQSESTNIFASLTQSQSDVTSQLQLDLGRQWSGENWSFSANYAPEYTAYARFGQLDYFAQSYQQAWQYALGPHTSLIWSASAERYPERGTAPGLTGLTAVASASQPLALGAVTSGGDTNLVWAHQSSLRSSWTANGTYSLQAFSPDTGLANAPGSTVALTPSSQSRSLGSGVGWMYTLSPSRSLNLSAQESEIWLSGQGQRRLYVNLQASLVQRLGSNFSVQAGVGPAEYWTLGALAAGIPRATTSYAANVRLTGQFGHSVYGLSWSHTQQTSLVPGSITTDLLALQYSNRWGANWSVSGSFGGSLGSSLTAVTPTPGGNSSYFASGQLAYRLGADWALAASASLNSQSMPVLTGAGTLPLRRAQYGLEMSYQFGGSQ